MEWDAKRLTRVLDELRVRRGDSTLIEVKRAAAGVPKSLATTLCAFANMPTGGTTNLLVWEAMPTCANPTGTTSCIRTGCG